MIPLRPGAGSVLSPSLPLSYLVAAAAAFVLACAGVPALAGELEDLVGSADRRPSRTRLLLVEDEVEGVAEGAEEGEVEREGAQGVASFWDRRHGANRRWASRSIRSKAIAIRIESPPAITMLVLKSICW